MFDKKCSTKIRVTIIGSQLQTMESKDYGKNETDKNKEFIWLKMTYTDKKRNFFKFL